MTHRIEELTKLTLQGKMHPIVSEVKFDRKDNFLPEHQMAAKRVREYVLAQEPVLTKYSAMTGLAVFDNPEVPGDYMTINGLKHINEILLKDFYLKPVDNLSTFEWQHATADYKKVIRKGIGGLLQDIDKSKEVHAGDEKAISFLNGLDSVGHTLIDWAHKCSKRAYELAMKVEEEEYRANLLKLSETLLRIPEHPAATFYEAVLSIYVCFSYDPDSIGTLDRNLYPYYEKDVRDGILTRGQAKEYLQELYLMLQAKTPLGPNFTRGGESHFCVGGYLPNGEDCFNDFSILIIEAMTELPTYIPQISLRWTKKLAFENFLKVLDFERKDHHKRIAFVSDEAKLKSFRKRLNFPEEVICNYSTVGCNETAFPGGFVGGNSNSNGARCLNNLFFERTDDVLKAKTFEEFFKLFEQELDKDIDKIIEYDNMYNLIRAKDTSLVTSLLFDNCIEAAKGFNQGAIKYATGGTGLIGITTVIDSLTVVKQFVYDEKKFTMEELVDALDKNWKGYENIHTLIKRTGKFFGNDDETSNYVTKLYLDAIRDHMWDMRNVFGFLVGIGNLQGYNPHHALFGAGTRATPDGRYDGEMLKFGIGQSEGKDRSGLTALLNSVARTHENGIMCGSSVTNVYLDKTLVNDDNLEKTAHLFETYFLNGGCHFQTNYLSKEELINAKETPENYGYLRVRVSGFSDYFTNLPEKTQDEIIKRTEHRG